MWIEHVNLVGGEYLNEFKGMFDYIEKNFMGIVYENFFRMGGRE